MQQDSGHSSSTRSLALCLGVMVVAMFGFGFLLVPIYDAFCEITGLGGKTNKIAISEAVVADDVAVTDRIVQLEFDTTVNQYAPWEFGPSVDKMIIHPGAIYQTTFIARNLTGRRMTAQAVPSIAPAQAAKYFKKLECFCFTTQEFDAHESIEMPVRFIVTSELPEYIDTITLSYTFFDTARLADDADHSSPNQH